MTISSPTQRHRILFSIILIRFAIISAIILAVAIDRHFVIGLIAGIVGTLELIPLTILVIFVVTNLFLLDRLAERIVNQLIIYRVKEIDNVGLPEKTGATILPPAAGRRFGNAEAWGSSSGSTVIVFASASASFLRCRGFFIFGRLVIRGAMQWNRRWPQRIKEGKVMNNKKRLNSSIKRRSVLIDLRGAVDGMPEHNSPPVDYELIASYVRDELARAGGKAGKLTDVDTALVRRNIVQYRSWSSAHASALIAGVAERDR
jgi:hypothetical protein